jgi:hypothetical protein
MKRRTFLKTAIGLVGGAVLGDVSGKSEQLPDPTVSPDDFAGTARRLKQEKGMVVGVLDDPIFSGQQIPKTLGLESFRKTWGSKPNVLVVPLNKEEVRSFSILFRGHLDVLVYPYGPLYPMDAFPFYTGDAVTGFLRRGGAVLTTGGVPFGKPVNNDGKSPIEGAPDPLSLNSDIYRRWVAPLGYKYYVHPFRPPITGVDRRFLPGVPLQLDLPGAPLGIIVNNSSHEPVPKPYHGNVFPERYPARSVTPLFWGADGYGKTLATNGVLVQDFEDGSRRIHLTHSIDPHPLTPGTAFFQPLMENLFSLLANRIFVKDVETNYACYRDGESVTARAEFISFESVEISADIVAEIRNGDIIVDAHRETVRFPPGKSSSKEWKWTPGLFEADEYIVSVSVIRNGQTVSRGENGFVVWKEATARQGPTLSAAGAYFKKGDGESFLAGTNYYESTRGEIMWFRPDVSRICVDLRTMRECGIGYIRPHYHHLKWFKDYLEFQHVQLPPYFKNLEAVASPMPDEHTWRMLDVFIYLCQKHHIIYGGDLFTLVPEEMGDPRGWFPLIEAVVSPDKRNASKRFFHAVNERYKDVPGIAWDLWNEPEVPLPLLKQWTDGLKQTLSDLSLQRLITVGGGSGENLGDSVDYLGLHIPFGQIRNVANLSEKPSMAQEVYLDHREDLTSELEQAENMREGMLAAVRVGLAGFAPWSWTRQMRLWQDSYEHDPDFRMESWDDRLGAQAHDDGTLKPAGQVFRDIALVLRSVRLKSFDRSSRSLTTERGRVTVGLKGADGADSYSLFHSNDHGCFAAISLESISWQGNRLCSGPAGAYLYAVSDSQDILTTKRLLFKSEQPGLLKLYGRTSPSSVRLVDVTPNGNRDLDHLEWVAKDGVVEMTTRPTQQAYWIAAEW